MTGVIHHAPIANAIVHRTAHMTVAPSHSRSPYSESVIVFEGCSVGRSTDHESRTQKHDQDDQGNAQAHRAVEP